MATEPKLLIADEAMAGLSNSEINDIVALLIRLNERGVTVILIEHIMRAVMSFSQRLVVLVSGKKIADGRPDDVIRDGEVEEGVSWSIASPSRASMRLRRRSRAGGRIHSGGQRRDRGACSAPTATARARS